MIPLVSIIMPAYNAADFIDEALQSCLMQTHPRCEIIVIDDGSTDSTPHIVQQKYAGRAIYLRQENAGPAAARNRGIEMARGEFIQFCDADDILLPEKIARCLDLFAADNESLGVVYTRYQAVESDGQTPNPLQEPPLLRGTIFCDLLLANGSPIQPSTVLARKSALDHVGGFRVDTRLRNAEDWDLFLRLACHYRFESIDAALTRYRRHDRGLSIDRYYSALGRLTALQLARDFPGREACLDDHAYDRLEAERYHVLAVAHWEAGRRAEARRAFQESIQRDSSTVRRLLAWMTYLFPASAAAWPAKIKQKVSR